MNDAAAIPAAACRPGRGARPLAAVLTLALAAALATTLMLGGCAGLPAARIELPDSLATQAPQTLDGLGGAAQGEFRLGALQGRFERRASRLTLFDRLSRDRASVRYTLAPDGLQAECTLRALSTSPGALHLPLQPAEYHCQFSRGGEALAQQLQLRTVATAAGSRSERRGQFSAGGLTLELQSLHRLQGTPLPQATPVGYLLQHQGRPVAALDLNDSRPRLWQAPAEPALTWAIVHTALALALLWDQALQ